METTDDDDDDLKLVKASASLITDLRNALPKILWKRSKDGSNRLQVHTHIRRQDLDYAVKLIDPFQAEPQLLDADLKHIVPPIVEACIQSLEGKRKSATGHYVAFESAVCTLLYTLCKVRGYKVILQFFNNEPRYLEPILLRLETVLHSEEDAAADWHVLYILLLWLAHLSLTPFDLKSLSGPNAADDILDGELQLQQRLPSIAERTLAVALRCVPMPTKAQDGAAMLLLRLVTRPDMRKLFLDHAVVTRMLQVLEQTNSLGIYEQLGALRFLAGVCSAPELVGLIPDICRTCKKLADEQEPSPIMSNAVAKKLVIKILRNMTILSLRPSSVSLETQSFDASGLLEDVIDYCLRSLADRDTPVRYAAAKALSMIVPQLELEMGHEVIQAILDSFQEDVLINDQTLDFRDANALKWHGLTLALAHTLFKRSASLNQLFEIVRVLVAALQFEQRTATGSSVGTNVRDAANFGIWSLSRRYTTSELLSVSTWDLPGIGTTKDSRSVIQYLAVQLILSACLDPAGNIRRGSSAALQELIGRHPNEVHEGIALVQIVDYQAVGLRRRAMLDVAHNAARLHTSYWSSLVASLFAWRGLGSLDVSSREAAALSLARLSASSLEEGDVVLLQTAQKFHRTPATNAEDLHGSLLALAHLLSNGLRKRQKLGTNASTIRQQFFDSININLILDVLIDATENFSLRMLNAGLPPAVVQLLAALCSCYREDKFETAASQDHVPNKIDRLTQRMLARYEDTVLQVLPSLVLEFKNLQPYLKSLGCLEANLLSGRVEIAATKKTLDGSGNAIALGALVPYLGQQEALSPITVLAGLIDASNVDWRVIGVKALQLASSPHVSDPLARADVLSVIGKSVHRAMNDYTIDERGDIGSLVRLQGIACASELLYGHRNWTDGLDQVLHADILRLSLEKLDRVRLAAAQCRATRLVFEANPTDFASISSQLYFAASLEPLANDAPEWKHRALLEGVISCAGISAEPLLQASRIALADLLGRSDSTRLQALLSIFAAVLKGMLTEGMNTMHAALELLAFLLDLQIPQRLAVAANAASEGFKWRNLLSTVQKSHHKSNDIPKILAAVQVYRGLADIPSIRMEVMKKLFGMLKTNPYPRVRLTVVEALYVLTHEPDMLEMDWLKPAAQNVEVVEGVEQKYVR